MASRTAAPVIVVGGGIGGMTTALALSRTGQNVHLLERAGKFAEVGAGLQLGPNVMRVFDRLGILAEIERIAYFPPNLVLMDALDGSEVARIGLGPDFVQRFGYRYATLHRADLHGLLTQACHASDLVTLETGRTITGFRETADGIVAEDDRGGTFAGTAMIAADGLWSAMRERVIGDGEPRVTGHIAYRAVLSMHEIPAHLQSDSVVLWGGPNLHLAHYPLRGGELFNMGAIFHSDRFESGADAYGDPDELHGKFSGVCEPVATLLGKIEEWRMWALRDRDPAHGWARGRVALLGDAAHPTLQYLAQGAGMAVEDAWTVAEALASAGPDEVVDALAQYERARFTRTARVTLLSRLYGQLYHASGPERLVRREMLQDWSDQAAHRSLAWLFDGLAEPDRAARAHASAAAGS